jgi:hypothetical protein
LWGYCSSDYPGTGGLGQECVWYSDGTSYCYGTSFLQVPPDDVLIGDVLDEQDVDSEILSRDVGW